MFCCLAAVALHDNAGAPSGMPAVAALIAGYLFTGSLALWVELDAQKRQRPLPYDYGSFVFFAWLVVVPVYLFSTRGRRAFIALGCFTLIYVAAVILGSIPNW